MLRCSLGFVAFWPCLGSCRPLQRFKPRGASHRFQNNYWIPLRRVQMLDKLDPMYAAFYDTGTNAPECRCDLVSCDCWFSQPPYTDWTLVVWFFLSLFSPLSVSLCVPALSSHSLPLLLYPHSSPSYTSWPCSRAPSPSPPATRDSPVSSRKSQLILTLDLFLSGSSTSVKSGGFKAQALLFKLIFPSFKFT